MRIMIADDEAAIRESLEGVLQVECFDTSTVANGLAVLDASGSLGMKYASPGDAGLGLAGMAERAALYGGTASAGPAPEGGWTIHAPLKGNHS